MNKQGQIRIELPEGRTAFAPGEHVVARVFWELPEAPRAITLRAIWYTESKAPQEAGIGAEVSLDNPSMAEARGVPMDLPKRPWSVKGVHLAVHWAFEVEVEPGNLLARQDIVISPSGIPLTLKPQETKEKKSWFQWGSA